MRNYLLLALIFISCNQDKDIDLFNQSFMGNQIKGFRNQNFYLINIKKFK